VLSFAFLTILTMNVWTGEYQDKKIGEALDPISIFFFGWLSFKVLE
jgi:hypothetical protein